MRNVNIQGHFFYNMPSIMTFAFAGTVIAAFSTGGLLFLFSGIFGYDETSLLYKSVNSLQLDWKRKVYMGRRFPLWFVDLGMFDNFYIVFAQKGVLNSNIAASFKS